MTISKLKSLLYIFNYLLIVVMLSACVTVLPELRTVKPSVEGKLIDADSLEPVIFLSVLETKTDKMGYFNIEAETEFKLRSPLWLLWLEIEKEFVLKKAGYRTLYCRCKANDITAFCSDFNIRLPRLNSHFNGPFTELKEKDRGVKCSDKSFAELSW